MKFTDEQIAAIKAKLKSGESQKKVMGDAMTQRQRTIFRYYDKGCSVLELAQRIEKEGGIADIDVNSPAGIKYLVETIKYFEELSKAFDEQIRGSKTRKDEKANEIEL